MQITLKMTMVSEVQMIVVLELHTFMKKVSSFSKWWTSVFLIAWIYMEEILDYTIYGCPFMDNEKTYWKK